MRKSILVVASVTLAMIVLGGVAWAATIQCPTHPSTYPNCLGTDDPDTMHGTPTPTRCSVRLGETQLTAIAEQTI
jgi:hypothetical protein